MRSSWVSHPIEAPLLLPQTNSKDNTGTWKTIEKYIADCTYDEFTRSIYAPSAREHSHVNVQEIAYSVLRSVGSSPSMYSSITLRTLASLSTTEISMRRFCWKAASVFAGFRGRNSEYALEAK